MPHLIYHGKQHQNWSRIEESTPEIRVLTFPSFFSRVKGRGYGKGYKWGFKRSKSIKYEFTDYNQPKMREGCLVLSLIQKVEKPLFSLSQKKKKDVWESSLGMWRRGSKNLDSMYSTIIKQENPIIKSEKN